MFKRVTTYIYIFVFAVFLSANGQAFAQSKKLDYDQAYDALFSQIDKNYTPYSLEQFDDAKLNALQSKDADAMYAIGMMYLEAKNTEQDYVQAREWFQKSSNLGNSDAMLALAHLYTLNKRITKFDKSNNRAKKWIIQAEKAGNPNVYYELGIWHERGIVFQKDIDKALSYYVKAAEKKIVNAYVKLFIFYYHGRGTEQNIKLAIENLIKIKKESPSPKAKQVSSLLLGELYMGLALATNEPDIKFKLYELAWSYGKLKSADAIGDMFAEGVGVRKNYKIAESWYEKAIESFESIYSMEKLGLMYLKGPGEIERDYDKAFEMFKRASQLGGVTGAHYLGYMYYYGLGVQKDSKMAKKWFSRSEKNAERVKKYGTLDNIEYETDVNKIINR